MIIYKQQQAELPKDLHYLGYRTVLYYRPPLADFNNENTIFGVENSVVDQLKIENVNNKMRAIIRRRLYQKGIPVRYGTVQGAQ